MRIFFALQLVLLIALTAPSFAGELSLRELDGEELHFLVYWTGIPAAEASLTAQMETPERMIFTAKAKSLSAVGLIYPMSTKIQTAVLLPELTPAVYTKTGREGWGTVHDQRIEFDFAAKSSTYSKDGKVKKKLEITPDMQDPLSCFYIFRQAPLSETEPYRFKVDDGSKIVNSDVTIVGREELTVPAGKFQTIKIKVNMENVGGVFAKSPGSPLLMWLTDDKWRRPVKMYSKVKIGDFTATLEHIGPPVITKPEQPPGPVDDVAP